jgi:hypothetical protein
MKFVHPLRAFALQAFKERSHHDVTSMTQALGAPTHPKRARAAYRYVALDLLKLLVDEGAAYVDE